MLLNVEMNSEHDCEYFAWSNSTARTGSMCHPPGIDILKTFATCHAGNGFSTPREL